jgi:hypothetical protein
VIVKTNSHDRMDLPIGAPTGKRSHWEGVPNLQNAYNPMVKRVQFLAEKGLTSMMVFFTSCPGVSLPSSSALTPTSCTPGRMMPRDWSSAAGWSWTGRCWMQCYRS